MGACFLGAVSDAMLLGHWYLVQPGLGRDPIRELVKAVAVLWPFELVVLPHPDRDGVGAQRHHRRRLRRADRLDVGRRRRSPRSASSIATWFALKERSYSAVMAATGLLYLAILTGFGMDLLPRALLG